MIATLANSTWLASCLPEYARFRRAVHRVPGEQQAILDRILRRNAATEFGRKHEFAGIRTVRGYQARVPLNDSTDIQTAEPVLLFEPTSGSTGATKLIAYTRSLQQEFQRAIRAWVADLFLDCPALLAGCAYWSVSPVASENRRTSSGIPIGFTDDSAYVGGAQQRLVEAVMAVPSSVRLIGDIERYWYTTLLHLIRRRDLRLISVWNPSFLTLLAGRIPEFSERLARDAASNEVRDALRANSAAERHVRLWPHLRVISCWTGANAAPAAQRLAPLFPQAAIRGKGLIATEGIVSFPMARCDAPVLAIRSHFFEFLPVSRDDEVSTTQPQLAHELERGQRYTVVLTTGGGLYRYQLHDLIEVTGHWGGCPQMRFLGRRGCVSDWFGEKLNEAHVAQTLRSVFSALHIDPTFAMLACETSTPAGYVLFIESHEEEAILQQATLAIESELANNFHYRYARQLGQLTALRFERVENAEATYLAACIQHGQRAGDVKPVALDRRNGWMQRFATASVPQSS